MKYTVLFFLSVESKSLNMFMLRIAVEETA
jgi:hypothetical protein